ncbi:hypothetical protein GIB67_014293 [Kingdonia uniflora]|uniref:RNase H type-1 domain-containing protein n=1 Tax=Kingdonia uniflora TaxID=39325 RepID=A0A7J7M245_9MAGN|nr:hypothetical protein GIB67_014293 [Kingdonia uniflora]
MKRRNRKKQEKNEQDKLGLEEAADGLKKVDKQKELLIYKMPSTTQPIQPHKTFKCVVELWDKTIRNWDGSIHSQGVDSQEVDKEASMVNKSWADMVKEADNAIQVNTEEVGNEERFGSESHASEFSSNFGITKPANAPFRFCNMWTCHDSFLQHILELSARVAALQLKLEFEIENDDAARDLTKANQLLTSAVNNDKDLWKKKVRVNCLQSGDWNTAYFHGLARIKRNKSLINSILTEDGRTLEGQDEIKKHIVDFFSEKFAFKAHPKLDLVLNQDTWDEFMRAKFISKAGNLSGTTKGSSIWAGVRGAIKDVRAHSGWVICDGACIDLWRDIWCSQVSLKDWINDDSIPWNDMHAKVSSIIVEGRWVIPPNLQLLFHRLKVDIHTIKFNKNKADRRVWKLELMGKFFVNGAFEAIRTKGPNVSFTKEKSKWINQIHETAMLSTSLMHNSLSDLGILRCLGVAVHSCKHPMVKSCYWEHPRIGEIKINTDGATKGNPRKGGIGCIFRDCNGCVLGTLSKGLGLVANFMAECEAIIHGVEHTASFDWLIAWIESESTTVVEAFKTNNIPWILEAAWENARRNMRHIRFSANWHEANFSVDALSI